MTSAMIKVVQVVERTISQQTREPRATILQLGGTLKSLDELTTLEIGEHIS